MTTALVPADNMAALDTLAPEAREVADGVGLLCGRYNGDLEDQVAVLKLAKIHGGVNGLLGKAELLRHSTGQAKAHCVAAAAVEVINAGRGGKKLPSWWREDAA